MFEFLGTRPRPRLATREHAAGRRAPAVVPPPRIDDTTPRRPAALPPSVARVAARNRLSADLLAALLTVDGRSRATLDDMERADALADALLARRRQRATPHRSDLAAVGRRG
ncbi:hypothetical protein [Frankia sp. AgKG'84/4]